MQTLQRMILAVAISLTFASGLASQLAADDVKSTLAVGDFVSGFEVTKWAGATVLTAFQSGGAGRLDLLALGC